MKLICEEKLVTPFVTQRTTLVWNNVIRIRNISEILGDFPPQLETWIILPWLGLEDI